MRTPKLFTERAVNATLDLQTGLDLTESDTGMEVCRNLVWENGRLQTRAGLLCGEWAQSPRVGEYIYWKMRFTDVISEQNGRKVRLAYDAVSDDISSLRIRTFWADESNHLTACGEILFLRTTSEIFYLPESVCFFSAGRIGGSGIYAFIRSCSGDEPEWFTVYELDTEENEWESVSPDYYYIPTIYINGRGDQYDFSYDAGGAYHPAPRSPESQNLLSGEFRAFFSSDGYSSRFQLPVTNLDNSSVFCRVYWDSSSYTEWVVPQNSSSVAVAYYTTTITLHCNRTTGELWFTTQAGEPFPVPKMTAYDGNNIHITASHTISDGAAQICGAKCMLASGEHLYLAGSSCHPGRICIARRSNPFYFPQDAVIEAGDDRHPILKMATLGGEVLAFKENEIYRITSSGSRYKIADQTLVEGES